MSSSVQPLFEGSGNLNPNSKRDTLRPIECASNLKLLVLTELRVLGLLGSWAVTGEKENALV